MLVKKDYKVLSNKKCIVCGCLLKQNLVDKNPKAEYCFKHFNNKQIEVTIMEKGSDYVSEAKALFPNAINEVEAVDLFAQELYRELRKLEELGQDSGKEFNAKKRKYKKVRDEYLEMRENFIEQESSMEVV